MRHWSHEAVFYHIYPLGLCGAPARNDFSSAPTPRLERLHSWLDHLQVLGVNALYLGPLFESTAHGYDTADYYHVDRRLGDDDTLRRLSAALSQRGIRLILDGVFNHVGRDFWAFRDLLQRGEQSPYRDWFQGLDFGRPSPYGDPFHYEGWSGHYDLVKLNLAHPEVRAHLFQAVAAWIADFGLAGLRLDAADSIDLAFLRELAAFARGRRADFWLLGEVVHGDYRRWANAATLDSVTNYEGYKSLYSSHVDRNYFELAYALNRQFGPDGLYRRLPLYAFADNHDVNRVASSLREPAHLYPLYLLLLTMPGVPSIYYGSEWGLEGQRTRDSDRALRPHLELAAAGRNGPHPDLAPAIAHLAHIRRASPALCHGDYRQLHVAAEQLAFLRQAPDDGVVVAANAAGQTVALELRGLPAHWTRLDDLLNEGDSFPVRSGCTRLAPLPPRWGRILRGVW